jgi:hypothetical protein
MLEPNDFFENQVKQCRSQAESAANKRDREFWLQLAHRWERLLQAGGAGIEVDQKPSFERPFFRKKSKQFATGRSSIWIRHRAPACLGNLWVSQSHQEP